MHASDITVTTKILPVKMRKSITFFMVHVDDWLEYTRTLSCVTDHSEF